MAYVAVVSVQQLPAFAALMVATACASAPEPLALPPCQPSVEYRQQASPSDADAPTAVAVDVFAVFPVPTGAAIERVAEVIVADREQPFRGRSRLPIGTLWLDDEQLQQWQAQRATLPLDQWQHLGSQRAVVDGYLDTRMQFAGTELPLLQLTGAGSDTVAVTLISTSGLGEERLALQPRVTSDRRAGLFVPATDPTAPGWLLQLARADEVTPEQLAAARAAAEAAAAAEPTAPEPTASWQVALSAVGAHDRRPALLALATQHDATRAIDVILAADERTLIAMTTTVAAAKPEGDDVDAWQFERAAWRAMLQPIERAELTPALFSATVRSLGALADDGATLDRLLHECSDGAAFAVALREENLVALDFRDAAVRVAAHAWLLNNGTDVPDYDPLAASIERRRALRRFRMMAAVEPTR